MEGLRFSYLIFRHLHADVEELALGLRVRVVTSRDLVLAREVGLRDRVRAEVWRPDLAGDTHRVEA